MANNNLDDVHHTHEMGPSKQICTVCLCNTLDELKVECTYRCRYCDNSGYWYNDPDLGPCDCGHVENKPNGNT